MSPLRFIIRIWGTLGTLLAAFCLAAALARAEWPAAGISALAVVVFGSLTASTRNRKDP